MAVRAEMEATIEDVVHSFEARTKRRLLRFKLARNRGLIMLRVLEVIVMMRLHAREMLWWRWDALSRRRE